MIDVGDRKILVLHFQDPNFSIPWTVGHLNDEEYAVDTPDILTLRHILANYEFEESDTEIVENLKNLKCGQSASYINENEHLSMVFFRIADDIQVTNDGRE